MRVLPSLSKTFDYVYSSVFRAVSCALLYYVCFVILPCGKTTQGHINNAWARSESCYLESRTVFIFPFLFFSSNTSNQPTFPFFLSFIELSLFVFFLYVISRSLCVWTASGGSVFLCACIFSWVLACISPCIFTSLRGRNKCMFVYLVCVCVCVNVSVHVC